MYEHLNVDYSKSGRLQVNILANSNLFTKIVPRYWVHRLYIDKKYLHTNEHKLFTVHARDGDYCAHVGALRNFIYTQSHTLMMHTF